MGSNRTLKGLRCSCLQQRRVATHSEDSRNSSSFCWHKDDSNVSINSGLSATDTFYKHETLYWEDIKIQTSHKYISNRSLGDPKLQMWSSNSDAISDTLSTWLILHGSIASLTRLSNIKPIIHQMSDGWQKQKKERISWSTRRWFGAEFRSQRERKEKNPSLIVHCFSSDVFLPRLIKTHSTCQSISSSLFIPFAELSVNHITLVLWTLALFRLMCDVHPSKSVENAEIIFHRMMNALMLLQTLTSESMSSGEVCCWLQSQ